MYAPGRTDFGMASSDDFSAKKRTKGSRFSDGGGAVFMYKHPQDTLEVPLHQWIGHRFICLYKHRPDTTDEFGEDMIMMCQYLGVMMFPENNLYVVAKYFLDRGYGGYLKYEIDPKTGKFKKNAGWTNVGDNPQRLWRKMRDHFTLHSCREMHLSLLGDVVDIDGIECITDYDRFAAAGGALMGAEDFTMEDMDRHKKEAIDIKRYFTNPKTMNHYVSQGKSLQRRGVKLPLA
jgi:hypothetical protein